MEGTTTHGTVVSALPPSAHVAPPRGRRRRRLAVKVLLASFVVLALLVVWSALEGGKGSYTFLRTMSDGEPITWDHCTAIRYQVNPDGAPENWRELVDGAFDEIAENSGFVFVDAGETANRTLAGTMHEIGHVLGLGHVDDSRQLMHTAYIGQDGLGPGDLEGLKALHDVPCG